GRSARGESPARGPVVVAEAGNVEEGVRKGATIWDIPPEIIRHILVLALEPATGSETAHLEKLTVLARTSENRSVDGRSVRRAVRACEGLREVTFERVEGLELKAVAEKNAPADVNPLALSLLPSPLHSWSIHPLHADRNLPGILHILTSNIPSIRDLKKLRLGAWDSTGLGGTGRVKPGTGSIKRALRGVCEKRGIKMEFRERFQGVESAVWEHFV
ncbi:hypothetical protein MNV49_002679, partial [Pseudohyphozyma bogoriensis]